MNRILVDLPEVIQTPRLKLQVPKAGLGKELYQAIIDGYDDYIKWLNWPANTPSMDMVEEECR